MGNTDRLLHSKKNDMGLCPHQFSELSVVLQRLFCIAKIVLRDHFNCPTQIVFLGRFKVLLTDIFVELVLVPENATVDIKNDQHSEFISYPTSIWAATNENGSFDDKDEAISLAARSQVALRASRRHSPSMLDQQVYQYFGAWVWNVANPHFRTPFLQTATPVDLSQISGQLSFQAFLGDTLMQTRPNTCSLVSAAMCIEAKHRLEYETYYWPLRFPCKAAAPRELRYACSQYVVWTGKAEGTKPIWTPHHGSYLGHVLWMVQQIGGIRTTRGPQGAPTHLPLFSWQEHYWNDSQRELTTQRICQLMNRHGPFIGTIWVTPWYAMVNSRQDNDLVYRSGCARNKLLQSECVAMFGHANVGLHAVVCFGYRSRGTGLDVHVIDSDTRWINSIEIECIHTIEVERFPMLTGPYPRSGTG